MIIGFAIVSRDGYIADSSGSMSALAHEEDFKKLQERLSQPNTTGILGRITHERHPNRNNRRRWILSHQPNTTRNSHELFFENEESLLHAIRHHEENKFYVLGGRTIYELLGKNRLYDEFNLSIRQDVQLGNGIPLSGTHSSIDNVMTAWGLARVSTAICLGDEGLVYQQYRPHTLLQKRTRHTTLIPS